MATTLVWIDTYANVITTILNCVNVVQLKVKTELTEETSAAFVCCIGVHMRTAIHAFNKKSNVYSTLDDIIDRIKFKIVDR